MRNNFLSKNDAIRVQFLVTSSFTFRNSRPDSNISLSSIGNDFNVVWTDLTPRSDRFSRELAVGIPATLVGNFPGARVRNLKVGKITELLSDWHTGAGVGGHVLTAQALIDKNGHSPTHPTRQILKEPSLIFSVLHLLVP